MSSSLNDSKVSQKTKLFYQNVSKVSVGQIELPTLSNLQQIKLRVFEDKVINSLEINQMFEKVTFKIIC
jgi:hypothetical protein